MRASPKPCQPVIAYQGRRLATCCPKLPILPRNPRLAGIGACFSSPLTRGVGYLHHIGGRVKGKIICLSFFKGNHIIYDSMSDTGNNQAAAIDWLTKVGLKKREPVAGEFSTDLIVRPNPQERYPSGLSISFNLSWIGNGSLIERFVENEIVLELAGGRGGLFNLVAPLKAQAYVNIDLFSHGSDVPIDPLTTVGDKSMIVGAPTRISVCADLLDTLRYIPDNSIGVVIINGFDNHVLIKPSGSRSDFKSAYHQALADQIFRVLKPKGIIAGSSSEVLALLADMNGCSLIDKKASIKIIAKLELPSMVPAPTATPAP